MITLRPDQAQVALYRGGYMAVPAVPGAGKTTVLAYLAADLIAQGLPEPGRVLIVTYTNSAVGNFRARIGDMLEERGLPRNQGYEVRTIHSLAMNILRERPDELMLTDNFAVIDQDRQRALLEELTGRFVDRHGKVWEAMIKAEVRGVWRERAKEGWQSATASLFGTVIQAFKTRRVTPVQALDLTGEYPADSLLKWCAHVYADYQKALATQGYLDFGDLILYAVRLLERDEEVLARLRQRWTYLFEDEAQDSYRLQEAILRSLAGEEGNLVRVGDANQAIMGTFTSAEPELFRQFCREQGVERRPLVMAGRSSQDIIDLANELVCWSRSEHPDSGCREALEDQLIMPVPADEHGSGPNPATAGYTLFARTFETHDRELQALARHAAGYVQRAPDKTAAILVPTNAMIDTVVALVEQNGAVVRVLGKTPPERLRTITDLLAVLRFLSTPHEGELLHEALCRLLDFANPESASFSAFVRNCRPEELFFPLDGTEPFGALFRAVPECRGWIEMQQALDTLRNWVGRTYLPPDELLILLAEDLDLAEEELAVAHYLAVQARRVLTEHPAYGLSEVTGELLGLSRTMGRFADLIHDRKGFSAVPGVVYVATCHAAKGLEWDTVYICSLTRDEYPSEMADRVRSEHWFLDEEAPNPEALALAELSAALGEDPDYDPMGRARREVINERLRLLYVAITRARENLMLTAHEQNRWQKPSKASAPYEHLRSFIESCAQRRRG